jgi:peptide deformylase
MASTSKRKQRAADREEALRLAALEEIRQFPDTVLRQRARTVDAFDDDLLALTDRMVELMHDAHGAGLAAPQIGLLRRVFVYHANDEVGSVAVINPEIVAASDEKEIGDEGCLSLAILLDQDYHVPVERSLRVTLRAQSVDGTVTERELEGYEARVVQHELDHLDGVLILDRATGEGRREAMRLLRGALT